MGVTGRDIQSLFNDIVPTYDGLNRALSAGQDQYWRRFVAHLVSQHFSRRYNLKRYNLKGLVSSNGFSPSTPFHVLDVATGTGDLLFAIAEALTRGREGRHAGLPLRDLYFGVDFAERMIYQAREKRCNFKRYNLEMKRDATSRGTTSRGILEQNRFPSPGKPLTPPTADLRPQGGEGVTGEAMQFLVADALALPFSNSFFDVVTMGFGIRNIPRLPALFQEVKRVLKPGGILIVLDFFCPTLPFFRSLFRPYLQEVLPRLGNFICASSTRPSGSLTPAYTYLAQSIYRFDYPGLLREAAQGGWKKVRSDALSLDTVKVIVFAPAGGNSGQ